MHKLIEGVAFHEYEQDLMVNIKRIITNSGDVLSLMQSDATILACLAATGRKDLIEIAYSHVKSTHGEDVANGAMGAASLMNMTNVYYSARMNLKSVGDERPALKMSYMKQHNIENLDFELYALAVSALNHCKPCVAGHERVLVEHNVSPKVINEALRIAAVIGSFSGKVI